MVQNNSFKEHLRDSLQNHFIKKMSTSRSMEEICDLICSTLCISLQKIHEKNNPARFLAISLIKKHTTYMNSEIGQFFGGISYSAVSKIVERFERKIKTDKEL